MGVLTNGSSEQQRDKLREIGLLHLVDVVCISDEIGVQKPNPGAFLELARQLGVTPSECLFVGDNPDHDTAGAQRFGMQALLVDRYTRHGDGILQPVLDRLRHIES